MVFPSQFEGCGLPLLEAFLAEVPTTCSNATCLPEQAGDAALIFDPNKPEEIADAILKLWMDDELCRKLVERGKQRVKHFTWDYTTKLFRAHYRRIARCLTDEDRAMLATQPIT
jgi:glycosyltransferase involved in cell wall biosynthesis